MLVGHLLVAGLEASACDPAQRSPAVNLQLLRRFIYSGSCYRRYNRVVRKGCGSGASDGLERLGHLLQDIRQGEGRPGKVGHPLRHLLRSGVIPLLQLLHHRCTQVVGVIIEETILAPFRQQRGNEGLVRVDGRQEHDAVGQEEPLQRGGPSVAPKVDVVLRSMGEVNERVSERESE